MKKLLFSAIVALTVAGVTQAGESTDFGVLKVPSIAKETIVAVPWVGSGTNAVKISDLVLTTNLSLGDELKYYNGSTYECWTLADDGSGRYWKPSLTVVDTVKGTQVGTVAASDERKIERGQALILKRTGSDLSGGFYIMGRPSSASGEVQLIANGYTLIAPPSVSNIDVNSLTWSNIESSLDALIVPDPASDGVCSLKWSKNKGKWRRATDSGWVEGHTITAGTGAWFLNGGTTAKKVSW